MSKGGRLIHVLLGASSTANDIRNLIESDKSPEALQRIEELREAIKDVSKRIDGIEDKVKSHKKK